MKILDNFFPTLSDWQDKRLLWLTGGLWALSLEIFSVLYFQLHLGLRPCEYCVKIRLAMMAIFVGAFIALLGPRWLIFKIPAYLITLSSAVTGLKLTLALEFINLDVLYNPYAILQCGPPPKIKLPFISNFPTHFQPSGTCGELDTQWWLFGFSMTQWLIMIYIVMILGLALMLTSFILGRSNKTK
ncbi:MAG: disulfide bond formation protein B [Deltaproteobacteria bacterium]|nr:disulfide bond formation protein B [Deltaproteobacteria bacterium]